MKFNFFSLDQDFAINETIVFNDDYFKKYNIATSAQISNQLYNKISPLAATAVILGQLLDRFEIPVGLFHTGQNINAFNFIYPNIKLDLLFSISRSTIKHNTKFVTFDFQLMQDQQLLISGNTKVTAKLED
ncbi:MAG: hypothetical protein QMB22_02695 [Dehalococcoidia bacterium]|jgi:hypothetical protein|nr:MAG: hypothetical protein DK305_000141 [Chloroflexota bacterium]|tara:strand:+ start:5049 stop:5441 length:393 start_codon:yes stop_codon:yes gene_type:complete